MTKPHFNDLTLKTEKERNLSLLEDAITKINSVIRTLNRLKAGGPEEKRKYVRMIFTLQQAISTLLKLEKKLCGKTSSYTKTKKSIAKRLRELKQQLSRGV